MAIRKVKINGEEHELQTTIANIDGLNNILNTTARLDLEDNENIEDASGGASANAVLYTPQTLTEAQKTQARANIGASSVNQIETLNEEKANKSGLTLGVHTDGLVYLFIDGAPHGNGLDIKADVIEGDVFGYVDENNTIVLNGNLADGTYIVKYEMENGDIVDIGNMVLDSNVYYSVTKNLTNCTISNSTTQIVQGGSYSATISANDGFELKSVSVTMGGSPVTVTGGNISIANVTGDIVITAVAEEKAVGVEPTNFFDASQGFAGRLSSSGADRTDSPASFVTNYVPVQVGDTIKISGCTVAFKIGSAYAYMTGYNSGKTNVYTDSSRTSNNYWTVNTMTSTEAQITVLDSNIAYFRFACADPTFYNAAITSNSSPVVDTSAIVINIKRNGEWL